MWTKILSVFCVVSVVIAGGVWNYQRLTRAAMSEYKRPTAGVEQISKSNFAPSNPTQPQIEEGWTEVFHTNAKQAKAEDLFMVDRNTGGDKFGLSAVPHTYYCGSDGVERSRFEFSTKGCGNLRAPPYSAGASPQ
jgi:hypothetical protein